jgi:hypothetical protein
LAGVYTFFSKTRAKNLPVQFEWQNLNPSFLGVNKSHRQKKQPQDSGNLPTFLFELKEK